MSVYLCMVVYASVRNTWKCQDKVGEFDENWRMASGHRASADADVSAA